MHQYKHIDLCTFNQNVYADKKRMNAKFSNYLLDTALQPIYSLAHKRIVGYEALLRVKDETLSPVNPEKLFSVEDPKEIIYLDRLSRYLHIHNFQTMEDDINWLFLNVSPQTIINGKKYGSFFNELLEQYNFPPNRVVIEIVEHPINDNNQLVDVVEFYKSQGALIAIDDFGAGHSNFDRIWTLKPDIVKLDRSFLQKASYDKSIENMLPGIVSLLHQSGAFVLLEGVETKEQAIMSIESNADFVQGYYFERPQTDFSILNNNKFDFETLYEFYKHSSDSQDKKLKQKLNAYFAVFQHTVSGLKSGLNLEKASLDLLSHQSVARCYEIRSSGVQIGNTIVSKNFCNIEHLKFRPLEDSDSADWFRRHYLKRALVHPGQIQITRPYLSITGAHMCITLSMMFRKKNGEENILCCDIVV